MFKIFLVLLFSTVAWADVALEKARFHKCYALFVRQALPETHPLWVAVKNSSQSGTDACMALIDKANFDDTGMMLHSTDFEGKKVLRSFSDLHMTFFNFSNVGLFKSNNTVDVIDRLGGVHYFTRALFLPGNEFREVVTLNHALLAKRSGTVARQYSVTPQARSNPADNDLNYLMRFWQGRFGALPNPNFFPLLVETGELIGIVKDELPLILQQGVDFDVAGWGSGKNMKQHFGGGFLGTQGFLLAHLTQDHIPTNNWEQDGALNIHRHLGKSILDDVLCRAGPYLRTTDVIAEVYPSSTIDFRKGLSCMSCHAAQDNIAAAARHLTVLGSNNIRYRSYYGPRFVDDRFNSRLPTASLPTLTPDPDFHKRLPSGKLFFRGFSGELINKEITNIASLGQAISETDDFYVCSVKKYYQRLTGIDVSLVDPGDINSLPLSAEHQVQRNKVIELGLRLKSDQNMKQILRDIIASDEFVRPGVGQ